MQILLFYINVKISRPSQRTWLLLLTLSYSYNRLLKISICFCNSWIIPNSNYSQHFSFLLWNNMFSYDIIYDLLQVPYHPIYLTSPMFFLFSHIITIVICFFFQRVSNSSSFPCSAKQVVAGSIATDYLGAWIWQIVQCGSQ